MDNQVQKGASSIKVALPRTYPRVVGDVLSSSALTAAEYCKKGISALSNYLDNRRWRYSRRVLFALVAAIEKGTIEPKDAIKSLYLNETVNPPTKCSREFLAFKASIDRISNSGCSEVQSYTLPDGTRYDYLTESDSAYSLLYNISRFYSLSKEGITQDTLSGSMRSRICGKRILEIGCGPGFFLSILAGYGGDVSGIDSNQSCIGVVPEARVRMGCAKSLHSRYPDRFFDLTISSDFFCVGSVLSKKDAREVLSSLFDRTEPHGLAIHQIRLEKVPLAVYLLDQWLQTRDKEINIRVFEAAFLKKTAAERVIALQCNIPSIGRDDLEAVGFRVHGVYQENGHLTFVAQKPH